MYSYKQFETGDLVKPATPVLLGGEEAILTDHIGMIYEVFSDPVNAGNYFLGIFWFNLSGKLYHNAPHPDGIYIHHWTQIHKIEMIDRV